MFLENIKPKSAAGKAMLEGYKNREKPLTPKQKQCDDCGKQITDLEETYSNKYFNKSLCRECQKKNNI